MQLQFYVEVTNGVNRHDCVISLNKLHFMQSLVDKLDDALSVLSGNDNY